MVDAFSIPSSSVDHILTAVRTSRQTDKNTEYQETLAEGHDHTERKQATENKLPISERAIFKNKLEFACRFEKFVVTKYAEYDNRKFTVVIRCMHTL